MKLDNKKIGALLGEYAAFLALVLLATVLGAISPEFRQISNLLNLLRQAAFNGLIAIGMTCVILSDGIDLSVGSVFALAAIICAKLLTSGVAAPLAILAALVIGTLLGLVSGILVAKFRLQAFIATLITMTAYRGLAMIITDGKPISRLAASIESDSGAFLFKALGKGNLLIAETVKIPLPAIILIAFFALFFFILNKTTYGRRVYATGSNTVCAKLVGVNTVKIKMSVYAISGFLAALAGLMMISRVDSAQPTLGSGYELDAIAAVDSDAVTGAVESAKAKGVKVISVDRAVNGVEIDCQIASDNVLGAELATQFIVDTLCEGAKVAELEGVPGASAAIAGAGKNILVMGFDATDDAIAAIKAGRMDATIAQQPALIGKTAVENAAKLISGQGIAPSIPVEVTLITAENVG